MHVYEPAVQPLPPLDTVQVPTLYPVFGVAVKIVLAVLELVLSVQVVPVQPLIVDPPLPLTDPVEGTVTANDV